MKQDNADYLVLSKKAPKKYGTDTLGIASSLIEAFLSFGGHRQVHMYVCKHGNPCKVGFSTCIESGYHVLNPGIVYWIRVSCIEPGYHVLNWTQVWKKTNSIGTIYGVRSSKPGSKISHTRLIKTPVAIAFGLIRESKAATSIGQGVPKHEKPPMSMLVRLPLDFQGCRWKYKFQWCHWKSGHCLGTPGLYLCLAALLERGDSSTWDLRWQLLNRKEHLKRFKNLQGKNWK
jgi:hypothetical protein